MCVGTRREFADCEVDFGTFSGCMSTVLEHGHFLTCIRALEPPLRCTDLILTSIYLLVIQKANFPKILLQHVL